MAPEWMNVAIIGMGQYCLYQEKGGERERDGRGNGVDAVRWRR